LRRINNNVCPATIGGEGIVGLQLKFNLMLVASFLVGLALAAYPFYESSRIAAMDQLQVQIDVLRAQALSMHAYTQDEVHPLLVSQLQAQFLPQSVPAYAAHTVFRNFRKVFPQFYYKEASLNPTNPADLAKEWEIDIINALKSNPQIDHDVRVRDTEAGPFYTVSYPLILNNEGCMSCHQTPDKAPASLVALYGSKNGFGYKLNDLIAAQIISVPMSSAQNKIWRNFGLFIGVTSTIFLLLLVLLVVLLRRVVVRPLKKMAATAEQVSMGDSSPPEYEHSAGDEVGSLSRSFNRMRRSMDSAMRMLSQ
jgi:HAMP domain-containing protein